MRLLLDSNIVVWSMSAPQTLSSRASRALSDHGNEGFVSVASIYELELKQRAGRLPFALPADWRHQVVDTGFAWLAIGANHAWRAANLPLHHRDPWDRMIIAQAIEEGLAIVSRDRMFDKYDVPVLW